MTKKLNERIIRYTFLILLGFIFAFFGYYRGKLPSERSSVGTKLEYLNTGWYQILSDGTKTPIKVPGKIDASKKEEVVITTTLPDDVYEEANLAFRTSKQDMMVLIDGEVRESYSTAESRVLGKSSVSVYLIVPLSSEDSGKELTVRFASDSSYAGVIRPVYYGEVFGIWMKQINDNAFQLSNGYLLMILAIVTIIGGLFMRVKFRRKIYLEYLGWGVLLIAFWMFFQSPLRQLYFRNISLASDMGHFCLMLLVLPISIYLNHAQKYRYNNLYLIMSWSAIINFVTCAILMATRLVEYSEIQYSTLAICAALIILVISTSILDLKKGLLKEYILIAYGFIGLSISAIFQAAMSFRTDIIMNGSFLCIGVLFLLIMSVISSVREHIFIEKEQKALKQEVTQKTLKVENLTYQAMMTLAETIDAKDRYTKGHSTRVAEYSRMIAVKLGLDEHTQTELYFMGLLHDIGKIGIQDSIINKPGRLNDEEFATIKSHSSIGFDILKNMTEVEDIQFGARWHHERYDGKGYPDGLKGEEIPEYARIIATADAYDAMTSNRSYRDALPQAKVREELLAGRGTQFDPKIADIMIQLIDEDPNYEMRQKDDEKCI